MGNLEPVVDALRQEAIRASEAAAEHKTRALVENNTPHAIMLAAYSVVAASLMRVADEIARKAK